MKRAAALAIAPLIVAAACGIALVAGGKSAPTRVKIGFLVKQPEEPWFQNEWKFARRAGADFGFDVIEIGATDGEKVLNGLDNLAAQGAKGCIICTPDVMLGPAIVAKAESLGLKIMSVDDRFVDADGEPIASVPHMGISSTSIGEIVGYTLFDQAKARGWKPEATGAISISFDELATARERRQGAIAALVRNGFPASAIFDSPQKFPLDVESGFNAAQITLTKHPEIRHWLIFGINDETVLGGIRATENRGFPVDDAVGVGIGGQGTAIVEFQKEKTTAFYATVTVSPRRHGYETAELMWRWIRYGTPPEKQIYTTGTLMTRRNMARVLDEMGLSDRGQRGTE